MLPILIQLESISGFVRDSITLFETNTVIKVRVTAKVAGIKSLCVSVAETK